MFYTNKNIIYQYWKTGNIWHNKHTQENYLKKKRKKKKEKKTQNKTKSIRQTSKDINTDTQDRFKINIYPFHADMLSADNRGNF